MGNDAGSPMARPGEWTSHEGGKKRGEWVLPQKSGSASDNMEQDVWLTFRPITTRPTHTRGTSRLRGAAADNAETTGWSDKPHHVPPTPHGWALRAPPSGFGKIGAARLEIAAPTASAGGPRPLMKTWPRRPQRWRRMEVKKEIGSASGKEGAGRVRQNVFFLCLVCSFLFPLSGGTGGKEIREP